MHTENLYVFSISYEFKFISFTTVAFNIELFKDFPFYVNKISCTLNGDFGYNYLRWLIFFFGMMIDDKQSKTNKFISSIVVLGLLIDVDRKIK